ncbi:trypsin-2-like [Pararge aegeria]|uniref:trypsin-2-like n=1 Tax=Pararge aegeria TaxID=116150 RepID=UPI0019D17B42|nr:trypsin-2-like [Pararge aegeria]
MVAVDIPDITSREPSLPPFYYVTDGNDNRIVGGYNTTIQEHPYQAFLLIVQGNALFQCAGSILNHRYILTAAHCIQGASKITARIGSTFANSGGMQYTSRYFRAHPFYNPMIIDYDVAYLRTMLRMELDGVNTKAIALPPSGTPVAPGTILTVSGWGATSENGNVANNLMEVRVPVVSTEQCRKSYRTITERMVCAGVPEGGEDSCGGDSGGPAVSNDVLTGIVSFGIGCARPGVPGVYTNVSSVRNWIKRNTGI